MAKSKYSKVDEYGFERPEDFNYELYDEFMSNYLKTLTKRSLRWNKVFKHDQDLYKKKSTVLLKRFIRKGIPNDRRINVWMIVSGAEDLRRNNTRTFEDFKQLTIKNQTIIDAIRVDLPRTFPDNIYFINQENLQKQLFDILRAFANQNQEIGYCQGLNYIAGLLLLITKSEEISFWLLKALIDQILPRYYTVNMSGLLVDLECLNELIEKNEPLVHRHIINTISMPWAMGTTKWFICLFIEVLPIETVIRVWDCLFHEGSKIIFRVAITLIKLHKQQILETKDLSELIQCFRNMRNHPRVIDCHQFIDDCFKLSGRLSGKTLEKMRKKYEKN